ncbi:hypothetical protein CLAIMM_01196 [Cladophialophora immunda]|nr:hypothetical protein CLAIMM_01196 [Cladophialophora immunda]
MTTEKPNATTMDLVEYGSKEAPPPEINYAVEKQLVSKIDRVIVPLVMVTYLLCFLDRTNIGNARLYGLERDLHLYGTQYQTAVALLFVTYVLVEIPSNLLLKYFTPSRYIAVLTITWGIISTLTGVVQNYGGLIACRLLLGLVEGGLFPGLTIYLTMFYTKAELALRIGYLFVSSAIAGACGGLLAYGIGYMDGLAGQSGWRWVFIIEGIPTVLFGFAIFFLLPDSPATAWCLDEEERQLLIARLRRQPGFHEELDRKDSLLAFKDWKVWGFAAGQFGVNAMLYSYSIFLPTIIKGLGKWSTTQAQALTVPVYIAAASTSIVGYGLLIARVGPAVHYFATFVISLGLFVAVGIPLAWLPSNNPRYAPFLYPTKDAPHYTMGFAVNIALLASGIFFYGFMTLYLGFINKRRREGKEDYKIVGMGDAEIDALGDRSPRFMYTI